MQVHAEDPVYALAACDLTESDDLVWDIARYLPSIRWVVAHLDCAHKQLAPCNLEYHIGCAPSCYEPVPCVQYVEGFAGK